MSIPVFIIGGGGHALVVIDALEAMGRDVAGVIDPLGQVVQVSDAGIPVFESDAAVFDRRPEDILLAVGVGGTGDTGLRQKCFEKFDAEGYQFVSIIHPGATVSKRAEIQDGAQIMAGCVIQPGCVIGQNSIINTRASIDHNSQIGDHVHIAPGVVLSGNVKVGNRSHIGTGASVVQGVGIGEDTIIGAGAVILTDIPSGVCAWGVPAVIKSRHDATGTGFQE
jgi:sugar O-acyltransferase (sialic acid O-acetyltransferase NeuD family)